MRIVEDGITKRKIKGVTDNGYFLYKGYVEDSDSSILERHKCDDDVEQISLTYYPIKDNKPILLLDRVDNYSTIRKLINATDKALDWLIKSDAVGFIININEAIYAIEIKDIKGNLLYVLKV